MIRPEEALRLVLENISVLPEEEADLAEAAGRVLARPLQAREDLPSFDNSAMDGFALRREDCAGASPESPRLLKVGETVRAGALARRELGPGEAVRIMTGAPLPPGADAVVMQELTAPGGDGSVQVFAAPRPGEHVRRRGEDVRAGAPLLEAGTFLRPCEIALLAAQGLARVPVIRRPRAAVVATGDELVEVAAPLAPGRIRNSNGPALSAALARWGALPVDLGIAPDEPGRLRELLERALREGDMVLVSGGVSVGAFDLTKSLLQELGLAVVFHKVAIKPGKPLLFGLCRGRPVFGLPGNPVSALVCLEEFVRPALEKMRGAPAAHPSYHLSGTLENEHSKDEGRQQYLFCRARAGEGGFRLEAIRPQGAAMLGMAARANALALAPIGLRKLPRGTVLRFRWLK